jgi:hypothetical protein
MMPAFAGDRGSSLTTSPQPGAHISCSGVGDAPAVLVRPTRQTRIAEARLQGLHEVPIGYCRDACERRVATLPCEVACECQQEVGQEEVGSSLEGPLLRPR